MSVELYTRRWCGYCYRAKRLLEANGVEFVEYDLGREPRREREMIERSNGAYTVPQVFVDGRHVGGSDELARFEREGGLEALITPQQED
jgi:glutaredoxin 3